MTNRESLPRVEARANQIIDAWLRAGFHEVEVYVKFARTETIAGTGGAILRVESREESGLAVRAFCRGGAMAFAASSWCEPDPVPPGPWGGAGCECVEPMLPDSPVRSSNWDGGLVAPDPSSFIKAAVHAAAGEVEISGSALATCVFNSHGVAVAQSATLCTRTLRAGPIERVEAARTFDQLVETSALGVIDGPARSLPSAAETPCPDRFLLAPPAAARLLSRFIDLICADRVRQRGSAFRLGSSISPALTIVDRGNEGPFGTEFDGEGAVVRPRAIAAAGKIESLLYDAREAALAGRRSTGNSIRHSYLSPPRIGTASLEARPGQASPEALRSEAAIEIADLPDLLHFQRSTGGLSVRGWGWRLRGGRRRDLVTLTLTAELPRVLLAVSACGDDIDHFPYAGWIGSPSWLIVMPRPDSDGYRGALLS